jgi:hypothetical protein
MFTDKPYNELRGYRQLESDLTALALVLEFCLLLFLI